MLVLTRRNGDSIHIGPDVTVTVLASRHNHVRLGIEAPDHIRIMRDELVDGPPAKKLRPANNEEPRDTQTKRVLVIEDDPLHVKLIRKALSRNHGTIVTVAESARSGLNALCASAVSEAVQPDLILLDVGLPDGSGLEILRAIRQDIRLRATPVVMLSCHQDDSLVKQCVDNGANAYVVKSPRWDEFRESVNRIGRFWTDDCLIPNRDHQQTSV